MAQGLHVADGTAVSPFIVGALPASNAARMGMGGQTPRSDLFAPAMSRGGASVGIQSPRHSAGRAEMHTMNQVIDTAGGHIDNGINKAGNGFGELIDNASTFGIKAAAVTSAGVQMAGGLLGDALTRQGPGFQFGDIQPPQQEQQGPDWGLMLAMPERTQQKIDFGGDFGVGDLGYFQAASVPDVRTRSPSQSMAV